MSRILEQPVADPATTTSIVTRVRDWAEGDPRGVAMRAKELGIWREYSRAEYWEGVRTVGHALVSLGIQPGDVVAIHSENRPEWLMTDLGAVAVRAITTGLYPTNPTPEVQHLLADSGARVLIAEDQEQVDKALAVADDLPELRHIVYIEPRGVRLYDDPRLMSWEDLLARGREHAAAHPDAVDARMAATRPDDVITLVYTSGTTGPPKGAMLTVRNVEFAMDTWIDGGSFADPGPGPHDVMVSYLPLCHVAERSFSVWFSARTGLSVNFAESIDTVQQNLREVQPTLIFGVPRIWEKMHAGVQIKMASASWFKRRVYLLGARIADRVGRTLIANGGTHTATTRILSVVGHVVVFRALRDRMGLRKVRAASSGAAPIAPEILAFFIGIGVPMAEVYGMTENSAIATANRPGRVKLGTVGEPHPGTELRIDPETGEIQTNHPGTFAGYWRNEAATADALTSDGWLKTGDVGEWVDGTHVRITDRMKDIIITAGGKNISPSEIENALKTSPFIKEAVVIGDGRKYLTALIGIELDTVGDWALQRRIPYTTYRDLSEKAEVVELVRRVVDDVNARFAQVEQIKTFRMLPKELDHEDGELTATQKVKRSAISDMFGELVDDMYVSGGDR